MKAPHPRNFAPGTVLVRRVGAGALYPADAQARRLLRTLPAGAEAIPKRTITPMDLNGLALPNRIWMSAMMRTRATADNIPTPLMGELRPARYSRPDRNRMHRCLRAGQGRHQRSGPLDRRSGQGLAWGDRSRPQRERPHLLPALALRSRGPPGYAGRRITGRVFTAAGPR